MEKDASAQQEKRILEAQAEAESIKLRGESRAFAIEARAKVISQKSYDSFFMKLHESAFKTYCSVFNDP